MITDTDPHSIKGIAHQIKKKVAVGGQTLINVMEEFEEVCSERNYFVNSEDIKSFIKLMKFNIDNIVLQVSEVLKDIKLQPKNSPKQDIQKVKGELMKQQKLNQLMKDEVLELNELISDHLKSNQAKQKDKDEAIRRLEQEVLDLKKRLQSSGDTETQKSKKHESKSNQISIVDEDDEGETNPNSNPNKEKQKGELEIIIQEQQLFSTSRYQPVEPSPKLQSDQEPSIIIKYKTEPNEVIDQDLQYIDLQSVNLRGHKKAESKSKTKFFLNDFRKIIQTDNVPVCLPSKGSSKFASGESSQSRLSVARNQSQNINLPYRSSTPKKLFSKKKKEEEVNSNRKPRIKFNASSIFEQKIEKSKLSERSNSINIPKQRPSSSTHNSRMSSKEKLREKDMNVHMSRPSSKQKLSLTIKTEQIRQRSSQDLSYRMPLKRVLQQEICFLDLSIGQHPIQMHYQSRSGSNGTGISFYNPQLRYEGAFKEGMRHGFGTLFHGSAEVYKGQWQHNKMCGKGRLQNINLINKIRLSESSILSQLIYIGEFEQNRLHGSGQLVFFSGDRIKTNFHDNRPEGSLQYLNKYNQISNARWYTDN